MSGEMQILLLVLASFILGLILKSSIQKMGRWFLGKASLIKKYWIFIGIFSFLTIPAYYWVYTTVAQNRLSDAVSILNQASMLIFSIGVGYLAFLQVIESRAYKLKEEGHEQFAEKKYPRAEKTLADAHSFIPEDFIVLAELMELFLINRNFLAFKEKLPHLKKNCVGPEEEKVFFYLNAAYFLMQDDIGNAKKTIAQDALKVSKLSTDSIFWEFDDVKKSRTYIGLSSASKTIFENYTNYLQGTLDKSLVQEFLEGNYETRREELVPASQPEV